jgi:uncharacterized protein (TIGR02118 family)
MQLVQGDSRHFRLIALYAEPRDPPEVPAFPGVLTCLWSTRTADQLPGGQVPALAAVLEVRCAYRAALEVVGQHVADRTRPLAVLATREHVVFERGVPPDAVKGIFLFRKREDLEIGRFQDYWRNTHGPIASRTPDCLRYVQCHVLPESYAKGAPPYDGVTEIYWPSFPAMVASMRSPSMTVEQAGDAPNFVAPGSVDLMASHETECTAARTNA